MSKVNRLEEPLLTEDNRYTQFPIKYPLLQKAFETHEAAFWSHKEIDYGADIDDWNSLTDNERFFIENILGFFAGSDSIVFQNLMERFCLEVKAPEARNFYSFQAMIENTHAITYALLLETFVKDPVRKEELFNSISTIPVVAKKSKWAIKWLNSDRPFEERLIAFAAVEGIFFSSSFASIFYFKSRNKLVKSLGKSNELISRDEGLHQDFAVLLYKHLNNKVSKERVEEIIREAVDIEIEFITESIPCRLIGMNSDLMSEYVKYVGDRLLSQLDFEKIYFAENPFDFMKAFSLENKTNFFEQKVTAYQHASTASAKEDSWDFGNADF